MSWKSFARKTMLEALKTNKLCRYVMDRCRNPSSRSDGVLYVHETTTLQKAISWRLGRLVGARCPICDDLFNRRHVTECRLLTLPPRFVEENSLKYQQDLSYLARLFPGEQTYYTWLDFLLNERQYALFTRVFDSLRLRLSWSD